MLLHKRACTDEKQALCQTEDLTKETISGIKSFYYYMHHFHFNLDPGSIHDDSLVCHLCQFGFEPEEERCSCYCQKVVHLDCYQADGESCVEFVT